MPSKLIATTALAASIFAYNISYSYAEKLSWPISKKPQVAELFADLEKNPTIIVPVIDQSGTFEEMLHRVNKKFNETIKYNEDLDDVWQRPDKTLSAKEGDCEDHAVAKWDYLLNHAGVEESEMMFVQGVAHTYINGELFKDWHLYLRVERAGKTYYLDSNSDNINLKPIEDSKVGYTLDRKGIYVETPD